MIARQAIVCVRMDGIYIGVLVCFGHYTHWDKQVRFSFPSIVFHHERDEHEHEHEHEGTDMAQDRETDG